ncbi:MAG: hypothetical protein A2667_02875 [Candidatus Wildermuthbacteria bacterium RIFCSPHIGHO2_01_FULL_47_27]|uniref:Uncharacterized protein n=2 Tax=Candidatus Wildermuthiibacteriota TaxID=1817923 RepID=A0A1G2RSK1_9BACT|nr:MAG: hypothetical protein UY15_C0004G0010 [Parcubacteria group bacterium GW2011_GWA2_47_9]OHA63340.1 MAG: hypothetical protein A2667_02875 [Candidatus Wildermuthbacteria bacterium RIFCSPHIGHO2_01_FULL_47_27]OHA66944.1 MAG: hypothetical protein A3D59_01820 [Candidatus Wildermuthbacteria bacterium RIFCSPHIGHO2_02_FULL_47_17]OHA75830.1 MAG: hypothetical protein A3A32_02085 [Candidatus Wildermuthbacteria bacterium RIFCSPLOWO2_01_FULL_48_35]OHA76554.1 MAG: hypothetical protein A3I38_03740 [Candid
MGGKFEIHARQWAAITGALIVLKRAERLIPDKIHSVDIRLCYGALEVSLWTSDGPFMVGIAVDEDSEGVFQPTRAWYEGIEYQFLVGPNGSLRAKMFH